MTYEEVASKLDYDPTTGKVFWKEGLRHRYSGKEAGYIHDESHNRYKVKYKNKRYRRSKLAWIIYYGEAPKGIIDHINGDPSDDRIENLRDVTHKENSWNCRLDRRNKTGVCGVRLTDAGTYTVTIGKKYLGTFETLEEATEVRRAAEKGVPFITERHGKPP